MRTLAAFSVLMIVVACHAYPPQEPEFSDADRQAVAGEVKKASEEWIAAWARNDIEAAMGALVDDPGAYFVGEPGVWLNNLDFVPSTDEVRAVWESVPEARTATRIVTSRESIAVLSRDHAVQVWAAEWNVTDAEGLTTPNYPLTVSLVWVRHGGTWRILHWHQTFNQEAVEG